jgi:hypothetical protein
VTRNRTTKAVIAGIATVLWLGYMVVGLALIDQLIPTAHGQGPQGTAAFIGLVSGVFVTGLIMWAASD